MTQALFYLLPDDDAATENMNTPDYGEHLPAAISQLYQLACQLAQRAFMQQQWVYIHCQDKQQAYVIDELLWQFDPNAFVPHNLKGEGPKAGAPVEIGFDRLGANSPTTQSLNEYDTHACNKSRQLLINLADQAPSFAVNFGHVIDFVANDEQHKVIARERYKQYRQLGVSLQTHNISNTSTQLD